MVVVAIDRMLPSFGNCLAAIRKVNTCAWMKAFTDLNISLISLVLLKLFSKHLVCALVQGKGFISTALDFLFFNLIIVCKSLSLFVCFGGLELE